MKFDTPGKKSNNSEDEGDCGLKFGGLKGSPGQSSMQTYEVMSHATSNSVMLDATIERGYTSSRLSRIRSDRKQPVSGKLRFNSEDSQSSGGGMSRGDLADVNLRPIRKVPVEQETATTRCCCFRLFLSLPASFSVNNSSYSFACNSNRFVLLLLSRVDDCELT